MPAPYTDLARRPTAWRRRCTIFTHEDVYVCPRLEHSTRIHVQQRGKVQTQHMAECNVPATLPVERLERQFPLIEATSEAVDSPAQNADARPMHGLSRLYVRFRGFHFAFGVPVISCSLLSAHFGLHSAYASVRDLTSTCATPFVIFVASYTQLDKHS